MPQSIIPAPHIYLRRYSELPGKDGRLAEHEAGLFLLSAGLKELAGTDLSPEELDKTLILTEHKKPMLSAPDLSFNISHSHGLAVCAFAPEPVGADAEIIRPVRENLARRVLSSAEYDHYANACSSSDEVFMRFWTLKEAYGKQTGTGLSYPMNQISFTLPENLPPEDQYLKLPSPVQELPSPVPGLSFFQWKLPEGYILSLCCGKEYMPKQIMLHFLP